MLAAAIDLERELMEDDRRLQALLAEGDPSSRRMVYAWCEGAATEILRYLAHGRVTATAVADGLWDPADISVSDWRYGVLDADTLLVEFRADGTWTTRGGRPGNWFGILEGSPQAIGASIVRELGLPRRSLHPRPRPTDTPAPGDFGGTAGAAEPPALPGL
jgi:hypothetical protein